MSVTQRQNRKNPPIDQPPIDESNRPHNINYQQAISRYVTIAAVLIVVYFTSLSGKESTFAKQNEILEIRAQNLECSEEYTKELETFPGCMPEKCGRFVSDKLVTESEAESLLNIARKGLALGGSDGGASILDLHSGALSKGTNFIDITSLEKAKNLFEKGDLTTYKVVKTKIQHAIGHNFGVDTNKIYLTYPTFFSRITDKKAATVHDEYWHPHVDKETYKSFHYTSLVYLNDFRKDFKGGRFIFIDKDNVNRTVEPRKGRISMFTSGAENPHFVEKVTEGTRYALTVSFTCDPDHDIGSSALKIEN